MEVRTRSVGTPSRALSKVTEPCDGVRALKPLRDCDPAEPSDSDRPSASSPRA